MNTIPHVLYLKNLIYSNNKFYIPSDVFKNIKNIKNINLYLDNLSEYSDISNLAITNLNILNNPIIITRTLHSCFAHALIEYLFPIFWIIQDIKEIYKENRDFQLFIRKKQILKCPQNLPFIDSTNNTYKGTWRELIELVTKNNLIFEHLIDNSENFLIKDCYVYIENDNFQRSIWNRPGYWPQRKYDTKNLIFSDTIIYNKLKQFSDHTKNILNISENQLINTKKNLIIINRKQGTRNINSILPQLNDICIKNNDYNFNGVVYLENLKLKEQILLYRDNDIIISPHGAGLTHCIWYNNKIIIEITFDNLQHCNVIFNRANYIIGNIHYQIHKNEIIEFIQKF